MANLPIGPIAKQTGVKVPTIRFYESIGLLPAPPRSEGNRRLYDESAVRRLRFIRHARELGFEVEAIRQLLTLADDPGRPCHEADAIARSHLAAIDGRLARLAALRAEVQCMVDQCSSGTISECRVIESLADL
jgi:DNA-binding transcriptional MerR regulator